MDVKNIKSRASQDFVPIQEIRDGVVILKNNSMRMILIASAINFALKSSDEQTAIIMQYQNFLNSLDFPLQIFIQSRSLNIKPYLDDLKEREKEQSNELLKTQMHEYIGFIREFVSATNIVNKSFYIVIPYTPGSEKIGAGAAGLLGKFIPKKKQTVSQTPEEFEESKLQIQQRVDSVISGLSRIGIRMVPLNTEELIELFFRLYNPSETGSVKLPEHGSV